MKEEKTPKKKNPRLIRKEKKYRIHRKNEGTWYNYFAVDKKGIIRKVGTLKEIKEFILSK
jgi:predicted KAP-like P-loop ATPase